MSEHRLHVRGHVGMPCMVVNTDYTMDLGHTAFVNAATGPKTITLTTVLDRRYEVKKIDITDSEVIVVPSSGLVEGSVSYRLRVYQESATFLCDGTDWWVVHSHLRSDPVSAIDDSDSPYSASPGETIEADPANGNVEIDLPSVVGIRGRKVRVRRGPSLTNAVILDPDGDELINDVATITLSTVMETAVLVAGTVGWIK